MQNHDLTERYIYAVTKRLPHKQQKDIADELRTLIGDMLDERCGEITPTEQDVRVVLTELGTPSSLADKYSGDGRNCLIGAPYYGTYRLILRIVVPCVALGLTVAAIVSLLTGEVNGWLEGVLNLFATLWSGVLQAFAIVTILFAIFYRKGVKLDSHESLDDLPPVPKQAAAIPKGECIFGIAFTAVFFAAFLAAPQFICCGFTENGAMTFYPVFNVETVRQSWYLLIAVCVLGIVRETVRLIEGSYYRKRVLMVTAVANVLSAVLLACWLTQKNLMDMECLARIHALGQAEGAFLQGLFARLPQIFLAVIVFALALDTLEAAVKTHKANR